jgi:hypothetical protein
MIAAKKEFVSAAYSMIWGSRASKHLLTAKGLLVGSALLEMVVWELAGLGEPVVCWVCKNVPDRECALLCANGSKNERSAKKGKKHTDEDGT